MQVYPLIRKFMIFFNRILLCIAIVNHYTIFCSSATLELFFSIINNNQ